MNTPSHTNAEGRVIDLQEAHAAALKEARRRAELDRQALAARELPATKGPTQ